MKLEDYGKVGKFICYFRRTVAAALDHWIRQQQQADFLSWELGWEKVLHRGVCACEAHAWYYVCVA